MDKFCNWWCVAVTALQHVPCPFYTWPLQPSSLCLIKVWQCSFCRYKWTLQFTWSSSHVQVMFRRFTLTPYSSDPIHYQVLCWRQSKASVLKVLSTEMSNCCYQETWTTLWPSNMFAAMLLFLFYKVIFSSGFIHSESEYINKQYVKAIIAFAKK